MSDINECPVEGCEGRIQATALVYLDNIELNEDGEISVVDVYDGNDFLTTTFGDTIPLNAVEEFKLYCGEDHQLDFNGFADGLVEHQG